MKKIIFSLIIVLGLTGCSYDRSPLLNTTDLNKVDFSTINSMKRGESCSSRILFFIGPFGSQEIVKAATSAKISKVEFVDYKTTSYVVYTKSCVIVYGK